MKTYIICPCCCQVITIEIEAASQQEAEEKALEIVGEHADATSDLPDEYVCKTVHRNYFTA